MKKTYILYILTIISTVDLQYKVKCIMLIFEIAAV